MRGQPDSCGTCGAGLDAGLRNLLFVCARNRLRSPTAEAIFAAVAGVQIASAGTAPDAECLVSSDLVEWAHEIFVMEQRQRKALENRFAASLRKKRVVCQNVPDR